MMLPWLAGHSFAQTMMLIFGLIACLGGVIKLITALLSGHWYSFGATLATLVGVACLTAAIALPVSPGGRNLMGDLLLACCLLFPVSVLLKMMHQRSKQASAPLKVQAAVHSDEVWPPPATSPGND